ncbi:MAG: DUF5989 family protein [Planctomycetaceae bacterium]
MADTTTPTKADAESALETTGAVKTTDTQPVPANSADDFARQAEDAPPGLIAEFVDFLIHNKKWWLTPIILVLLLLGLIVVLGLGGPAAPFIYPMF